MLTATTHTRVLRYVDPVDGLCGFLALAGERYELAAGGLRVQPGLREETVAQLAEAMELKERLLGLAVDGAKAGIDYDPRSPGKKEALGRFLRFLRPWLAERVSLGPDMGTTWSELEHAARGEGITSIKMAVARAQGLDEGDFLRRLRVLDDHIGGLTLGQRRAGHALAHAALAAAGTAVSGRQPVRVGIQGFGNLGRGAAVSLVEAGATVTALADEHGCSVRARGFAVEDLLGAFVPPGTSSAPSQALFDAPCDVLVLAACEDALSAAQATRLHARAVVVGANLGLAPAVELRLHERGILVVPDLVGGCGGSASMDALFGSPTCPRPGQVLDQVGATMQALVRRVLDGAARQAVTTRAAAVELCATAPLLGPGPPYGRGLVPGGTLVGDGATPAGPPTAGAR